MNGTLRRFENEKSYPEQTIQITPNGRAVTFSATGGLLAGEDTDLDDGFVVATENDDETLSLQVPSEFFSKVLMP